MAPPNWPKIADEALVERLIPALQRTIADATREAQGLADQDYVAMSARDVANVLLMVLATVLEPSPDCSTPMGMRQMGEAAGKELGLLIRDTRRLKLAQIGGSATKQ